MSILFCNLYVNIQKMKILKELDRQAFTERFTSNQDCYEFLADLKLISEKFFISPKI